MLAIFLLVNAQSWAFVVDNGMNQQQVRRDLIRKEGKRIRTANNGGRTLLNKTEETHIGGGGNFTTSADAEVATPKTMLIHQQKQPQQQMFQMTGKRRPSARSIIEPRL